MSFFSYPTLIVVAVLAIVLGLRLRFWYRKGQKLQQDGYLPPNPTWFGQWLLRSISRLVVRLKVGPVKVIGQRNARYRGRLHILPNHQFPLDFMVTATSLPYGFRHLGTAAEMKGAARGTLSAMAGFFAVKTEKGKATEKGGGDKVVDSMARAMAKHPQSRLLTFPQGTLVKDNTLRTEDFRTGAIRAMQRARDEYGVGSDFAILPMAIHYLRERRYATWFHRLVNLLGWRNFRALRMYGEKTQNYGAVVVIGQPIPLASLPEDPREAIDQVCHEIEKLLEQGKGWASRR